MIPNGLDAGQLFFTRLELVECNLMKEVRKVTVQTLKQLIFGFERKENSSFQKKIISDVLLSVYKPITDVNVKANL